MRKKLMIPAVLALLLVLVVTSGVLAQDTTPTTPKATPTTPTQPFLGKFFGFRGGPGGWTEFDALAKALNLTPTELFEQLHSGKTLDEIAEAQGVDLTKVQDDLKAARLQAMKDRIAEAVAAGTMTQEQADWLLKGLENGWTGGGRGLRGHGFGGRGHGFGGMPFGGQTMPDTQQQRFQAPVAPAGAQA